ncbi:MAG TPA: META domain-containing protein [bacterium]|nr:META domain-containing protein [bacterium]
MSDEKKQNLLNFLLVICLLAAGCEFFGVNVGEDDSNPQFTDTKWELEAVAATNGSVLLEANDKWPYWVRFRADGTVEAMDACNTCEGEYQIGDGFSLSMAIGCTEKSCGPSAPSVAYGDHLNHSISFVLGKKILHIRFVGRDNVERVLVHRAK